LVQPGNLKFGGTSFEAFYCASCITSVSHTATDAPLVEDLIKVATAWY
jgi:hypothetical protein